MPTPSVKLQRSDMAHFEDCCAVFYDSTLYQHYFAGTDRLENSLRAAIEQGDLWVATATDGEIVGAMHIQDKGFMGMFPYLALFGVKKGWRGMGIGEAMLKVYEGVSRSLGYRRTSMMVSSFNPRAKRLYQKMGYKKVGLLPDAVCRGTDENIMVKDL